MARATFHLQFEITIEILSRLPVKSLLRFQSVCKTWYALIKTPSFIAQHDITQSTLDSTSLLVITYNGKTQTFAMSLVNEGFSNGPVNLDFPFLNRRNYLPIGIHNRGDFLSVGGICNGLAYISLSHVGYPLILCNPSTRKFRDIPNLEWNWLGENDYNRQMLVRWVSFGFGFHPSARDYKLI
ncbi:putative F-box protein At2g16220 [Rhododendron vialii]|uniref:putative F-box protein At2g16220 n=1 Tax=Rhododendron vialii TaxID=182163 RepID=UPI00265E7D9E|nr:putative F-box protein At2g16220 [Rhododendron vialii]